MSEIPRAQVDANRLLHIDLYDYLDEAEGLASKYMTWGADDIDHARSMIPELVLIVRGMVVKHESDDGGQCAACAVPWPCDIVGTVHRLVTDPLSSFTAILRDARMRRER